MSTKKFKFSYNLHTKSGSLETDGKLIAINLGNKKKSSFRSSSFKESSGALYAGGYGLKLI